MTRIPSDDIRLFNRVRHVVTGMSDIDLGEDGEGKKAVLSCHILARAIANIFDIGYTDGRFLNHEHSWVLTPNGNIIDVYPIAIVGGPFLVDHNSMVARSLYREGPVRTHKSISEKANFDRAVRAVAIELQRHRL
jgi:hypothetical protein